MTKSASAGIGRPPSGGDHPDPPAAQGPGEGQLGQPLGQRHHGGDGQRRRAADEDVDPERLAPPDRRRVVDADPPVDLVVQADLAVRLVLVPRELDPVHPQVRLRQAGPVGVLGVDLRQGDERPAVVGPATGAGAAGRASSGAPGSARDGPVCGSRCRAVHGTSRYRQGRARAAGGLTFSSTRWRTASRVSRKRKRVRSIVPNRLPTIGKAVPLTRAEEERRPAGLVDPALDGGGLQVGVDLARRSRPAGRSASGRRRSRPAFDSPWRTCDDLGSGTADVGSTDQRRRAGRKVTEAAARRFVDNPAARDYTLDVDRAARARRDPGPIASECSRMVVAEKPAESPPRPSTSPAGGSGRCSRRSRASTTCSTTCSA